MYWCRINELLSIFLILKGVLEQAEMRAILGVNLIRTNSQTNQRRTQHHRDVWTSEWILCSRTLNIRKVLERRGQRSDLSPCLNFAFCSCYHLMKPDRLGRVLRRLKRLKMWLFSTQPAIQGFKGVFCTYRAECKCCFSLDIYLRAYMQCKNRYYR